MALKKPSELFNDKLKKSVEVPEHLERLLPENFDEYKSNLKNIEILNDFVSSFGTLKENIQKIDDLQEVIQSLKEDLQNSITKENLDTAMMSNLLILEKNIQKIELNLKGINRKDLNRIDEEIGDIENKVVYVLEEEFPKYKKALKSNEIFIKDKFYEYSSEIDEKVNQFEKFIKNSFDAIQENLQSINDSQLFDIRENVVKSSQEIESQNQIIEKTKKQIFGLEKDVQEFYQRIQKTFQSYQQSQEEKILTLEESISSFGEKEIKKYRSLLQETRIQNDEKIHSFEKNLTGKYTKLSQSVSSLLSSVENKSITIEELKENLEGIQDNYSKKEDQQKDIDDLKEQFTKKINLLENDISFKESKIKKVNQELTEEIKKISNQFDDLNVEGLKKKYSHLTNKISYIEEVFEKFNEKTILNEGLLNEPPTIKNEDPLTPLDNNFVTLDQLNQHYRLFINRIQQQLSTLGGGGEIRLEFLDDIDRDSAKVDGRFLKYDASSGKWIGALGGGGGSQTLDDTLGFGNTSSLGISVGISTFNSVIVGGSTTALVVNGDARITGILTIGTASITLDGQNNVIKVGTGITLTSNGNASYSGIITAIAFIGDGSGLTNLSNASTATYATNAGIATALQNSRTFEITGDVIASQISFDGTGNVSLAATIQPNSVGLGTDTFGDYVKNILGTSNQVTVTSGTGEGSLPTLSIPNQFTAPQDIEVTRDLQVNRNLNVNGNITIGGTSATLFTTELKVYDPDLVLGFRTDAFGNDVSTDNTANHGGIAIASTEGNPLVQLFIAGIETTPATYKKIMWFKAGEFAGLGTDAWLSNYAVGIGSTQFPSETRLAAGAVQFTERDLSVVRNVNASGVVTASSFSGNASSATYAPNAGVSTSVIGGIGSISQLQVSGISTFSNGPVFIGSATSTGTVSQPLQVTGGAHVSGNLGIGTTNPTSKLSVTGDAIISGIVTATSFRGDGSLLTGITAGVVVRNQGSTVGTATTIDFSTNLTATFSNGVATITASGGGGGGVSAASIDLLEVMLFS